MIIPDLNILVYAFNSDAPYHREASSWWESVVNAGELIGIPWVVYLGFLRLLSGRQVVQKPYPIDELLAITRDWFCYPNIRLLYSSSKTQELLEMLMSKYHLPGSLVTDAAITAAVMEHRGTLYSNDTDFKRFTEIRVRSPLGGS